MRYLSISFSIFTSLVIASGVSISTALAQSKEYSSDFNGDGYDDLAISIPGKNINGVPAAGAIRIIYGAEDGLVVAGSHLLHRGAGAPGAPLQGEFFGRAITVGDFNGDGFADLASGTWFTQTQQDGNQIFGTATVFYGSQTGLRGDVDEIPNFTNGSSPHFASALAAGDFNNDGFDELVIGLPFAGNDTAGGILVMKGTAEGLVRFTPLDAFNGFYVHTVRHARFGGALSAGYFNDDDFMDLAVGAPGRGPNAASDDGGNVYVLLGSANWLPDNVQSAIILNQDTEDVAGQAEARDGFGAVLAAGDFDGRAGDELAVGVPFEGFEGTPNGDLGSAGVTHVFSTAPVLSGRGDQFWHQDVEGMGGQVEGGDFFGGALATGDFNDDGRTELVIGVTGEDFSDFADAGVFHALDQPNRNPSIATERFWHSDAFGLGYGLRQGDGGGSVDSNGDFRSGLFGVGDFNGDGYADLARGVSSRDIAGVENAGAVIVIYGGKDGLAAAGNQFWAEHTPGLASTLAENAGFGWAVSSASRMKKPDGIRCGLICRVFGNGAERERTEAVRE